MTRYNTYFHEDLKTKQLLATHGFEHWPTEEEQMRYLMSIEDKIDALASALNLNIQRDIRNRWSVTPAPPAPIPPRPYWETI